MVCLAVQRLKPGMIVARPVLRSDGAVLLNAGAELDENELSHIHQRGVEFVFVEQPDPRDDAAIAAEQDKIRQRIDYLFRPIGEDNDARRELRAAILAYRLPGGC